MTGLSATGPAGESAPQPWYVLRSEDVLSALSTDRSHGLSGEEASARLGRNGPNALHAEKEELWWEEALESIREPLQLLLLAIGVVYFLLGEIEDAVTILAVIVAVTVIEVANELRAKRAVAALSSLGAPMATVIRDGVPDKIPARDLVPGDLILLAPGDRVPADVRLIETAATRVDESSLTGESVPTSKAASATLTADAELGDRRTMAYAGTLVTAGKASGVVVATGRETELGRIAGLTEEARELPTPLQRSMRELSGWLVWVALGVSVLVPLLGIVLVGLSVEDMVLTGLTLAFATIPEELPILITIVLGIGSYQLARRGAIVKRLQAAETLGSVSVVATDKTGTLTENRMRVAEMVVDGEALSPAAAAGTSLGQRLLEIGVLASDAQVARSDGRVEFIGDPTETALLAAAEDAGLRVAATREANALITEFPFDDDRKRMSVIAERDGRRVLRLKGAAESVLADSVSIPRDGREVELDDRGRAAIQARADEMAARGLRVLAFAERSVGADEPTEQTAAKAEAKLTLIGLVGLEDPPRPEAAAAVRSLGAAGVRVLMLTGDHPTTAAAIAEQVGIRGGRAIRGRDLDGLSDEALGDLAETTTVFARITPEHKLRVVRALQAKGEIVAVTGDGVNDAPALREAAIGVAMGERGTDVAREAADIVLADDNLATITAAVRAGRTLYANLRKAIRFYLAVKVALVSASLAAVLFRLPVPFEPVQIILMELFMDIGASMTFVTEPPEEDVMARPPRDARLPFMDRSMQFGIVAGGLSLGVAVLIAYLFAWAQGLSQGQAQTAAFAAWMVGHVVLAANMRTERASVVRTFLSNRAYLVWAASAVLIVVVGLSLPFVQERLHLQSLPSSVWLVAIVAAIALPSWWEVWKRWRHSHPGQPDPVASSPVRG
jgi:Ca2+-transporting ATPase